MTYGLARAQFASGAHRRPMWGVKLRPGGVWARGSRLRGFQGGGGLASKPYAVSCNRRPGCSFRLLGVSLSRPARVGGSVGRARIGKARGGSSFWGCARNAPGVPVTSGAPRCRALKFSAAVRVSIGALLARFDSRAPVYQVAGATVAG